MAFDGLPIRLSGSRRLPGVKLAVPVHLASSDEVVRMQGSPVAAIDGDKDTSPSKMTRQRAGEGLLTTSSRQPHVQMCPAMDDMVDIDKPDASVGNEDE